MKKFGVFLAFWILLSIPALTQAEEPTWLKETRALAASGDAEGQFYLGLAHLYGEDVTQNAQTAVEWLTKAAEQQHLTAQAILAAIYAKGQGNVAKDLVQACMWTQIGMGNPHETQGLLRDKETKGMLKTLQKGLSQEMTADQTAQAQRLVEAWQLQHP